MSGLVLDRVSGAVIAILASIGAVLCLISWLKGLFGPDDPDYKYTEYKGDE